MLPFTAATGSAKITQMNLSESLLMSLLGMAIVMLALASIMALVKMQSSIVARLARRSRTGAGTAPTPAPAGVIAAAGSKPAPGGGGEVKLFTVPEPTAALIMAIVASELQIPLNELRFISIREV